MSNLPTTAPRMMPEDPDERAWFDHQARRYGGPLRAMAGMLAGQSTGLPDGSLKKMTVIFANEAARAADAAGEPGA